MNTLVGATLIALILHAPTSVASDGRLIAARDQARRVSRALIEGDYESFVSLTHPRLVHQLGGRETMIASLRKSTAELKGEGYVLRSVEVGVPIGLTRVKSGLLVIVPTTVTMAVAGRDVVQRSVMVGASDDGKRWSYIDGSRLEDGTMKHLLPDLPPDFAVPPFEDPARQEP
ncbi:MAG: hypothetical protein HY815_25455 [Candidatus Riflebacteria bacterium]|nr:hypothetical protein [Candidatus Riflebacteria bacterium]